MNTEDQIRSAIISLVVKAPFFASFVMQRDIEITDTAHGQRNDTACTDGIKIYINQDFFASLDRERQRGLLAHEVLHITNLHHIRRGNRNPEKWNEACDYAINYELQKAGFKLPKGALVSIKYDGWSAEAIYDVLPDERKQSGMGFGGVIDCPEDQRKTNAQEVKQIAISSAMASKGVGSLPDSIARMIDELINPKLSWKELIPNVLFSISKDDYSWKRQNRRYAGSGLYLPSLYSERMDDIVMVNDTSGSRDIEDMNIVAAEIKGFTDQMNCNFQVMYVDAILHVNDIQSFGPGDDVELHPVGGGGTDFVPAFEYIEEEAMSCAALIYFTDGYCSSYPDFIPDYPVIWIVRGRKEFYPPFGNVAYYED